jgi:hypothetical protein
MPSHDLYGLRNNSIAPPEMCLLTFRIEMNASFKHNKTVFKQMGFEPAKQEKRAMLYWLDGETYKTLNDSDWKDIEKGVARL